MSTRWPALLHFAAREMRGGMSRFGVFLACIALGVAAIAAVLGTSSALQQSLAKEGRHLLGGDAEFSLIHRRASAAELELLASGGRVSEVATLRAMARPGAKDALPALVEMKAIDANYPLSGTLDIAPKTALARLNVKTNGAWGALAEKTLLARLNIGLGGKIRIGRADFIITGIIIQEPDRLGTGFPVGPRVLINKASLADTGLITPGSLIRWHYRVLLSGNAGLPRIKAFVDEVKAKAPEAGWRIRDRANAAPRLQRFVSRVTIFFTFIALTSLITGGVGVAASVKNYLDGRRETIAILKCLGLTGAEVFTIYLLQILALTLAGIAMGLVLGASVPFVMASALQSLAPLPLVFTQQAGPLLFAAASGLLTSLAFAFWPLGRARDLPATSLFRDLITPHTRRASYKDMAAILVFLSVLAALVIFGMGEPRLGSIFVIGAALCFGALALLARGLIFLARRVPSKLNLHLRLGVKALYRPGSQTPGAVLALGLGLTLLVALVQVDLNLSNQLSARLPERAPSFFFASIRAPQLQAFRKLVEAAPGVKSVESVPMLRGRIVSIKGVRVEDMKIPDQARWVLRGDRGITFASSLPRGSSLVKGKWWPPDYSGPPLISFSAKEAGLLGLEPGDAITVNVMGRKIKAKIANMRKLDWSSLGINFVMVFSPATFKGAPHTNLATVSVDEAEEGALLQRVASAFENVTALRVKEALGAINTLLRQFMYAVRTASLVAVATGAIVLAGALAAGMRGRIYDAAIFKAVGATRKQLMFTYAVEFLILGLAAGGFALLAGSLVAWGVVSLLMNMSFAFYPGAALLTAGTAIILTLSLGFTGAWRALGKKAAPVLRAQ